MSAKEMFCKDAASLIEELSDEALTACVGGTGYIVSARADGTRCTIKYSLDGTSTMSITHGLANKSSASSVTSDPNGSSRSRSDRNKKENFSPVDVQEVLEGVAKLPIKTWNYKQQNPQIRHIGPMSQDFAAAFGVGEDNLHIDNVDANGVTLSAIQALYKMLQEKSATIDALRADFSALQQQVNQFAFVEMPAVA